MHGIMEYVEEDVYQMVKSGDTERLGQFLEGGLDVNHPFTCTQEISVHGMTLIQAAVADKNVDLIKFLIEKKCDVNRAFQCVGFDGTKSKLRLKRYRDRLHLTSLFQAICSQDKEILRLLVKGGADVNLYDCSLSTALWHAVDTNNEKITQIILEAPGCDVNARDIFKMVPMHIAAVHGNVTILQQLLDAGSQVDPLQLQGASPLCVACKIGQLGPVNKLLQHGANPNIRACEGVTPLRAALEHGKNTQSAFSLITAGAFIYSKDLFVSNPDLKLDSIKRIDKDLYNWLIYHLDKPRNLKVLCALQIRAITLQSQGGHSVYNSLSKLPLPVSVIDFLQLNML